MDPSTDVPGVASAMPAGPVHQVVLQPTPYCNLDCAYCYLPNREDRSRMKVRTAVCALERVFEYGNHTPVIDVRWHSGEPLTVPRDFYREAFDRIAEITPDDVVAAHSVQTNGVAVNAEWAQLFSEYGVRVGVSLDGPPALHDRHRRTRSGRGSCAQTLRGVRILRRAGVRVEALAVVTERTLDDPDGFYDFFADNGIHWLGLNVERSEGINVSRTHLVDTFESRYAAFLTRLAERSRTGPVRIRELVDIERAIRYGDGPRANSMLTPLAIITVDHLGFFSTFTPELLSGDARGRFRFGNVHRDSLTSVLTSRWLRVVAGQVERGRRNCVAGCGYVSVCGGGSPSIKWHETGSFESTETAHCRSRFQIPADVMLGLIEQERTCGGRVTADDRATG